MQLISRGTEAIVMVLDVVRGYLAVAGGLTDITVQRARHAAEAMITHGSAAAEASSEQVGQLAEELVKQSQTNREVLVGLIRTEVDRAVGRMGFVREEELAAVRNHVLRLEAQLKSGPAGAGSAGTAVARTVSGTATRKLSTASGAVASAVPGRKRPGTKPPAATGDAQEPASQTAEKGESGTPAPTEAAPRKSAPAKAAPAKAAPAKAAPKTAAREKAAPNKAAAPKKAAPNKAAPKEAAPNNSAPRRAASTSKRAAPTAPDADA